MSDFDLETYLSNGIRNIVSQAIRAALTDPRESLFLARYSLAMKKAEKIRQGYAARGEHIPPFLIASITSACNLHCAGCYSRANHHCVDTEPAEQMSGEEWASVFRQARELGIGFILLAGGEPTLRRDVIQAAAKYPEIIFPVFTNGTMLDDAYLALLEKHRNLIPVVSLEGRQTATDHRRGDGVFAAAATAMERMKEQHLTFGVSLTQTTANRAEITGDGFLDALRESGAKVVFYIEFVPVTKGTEHLAPGEEERQRLQARLAEIRAQYPDLLFISFPGDEKTSGGCLAAGRGFFHINSHGSAEPCPFSPYSDISIRSASLREALSSPLFRALQSQNILLEDHAGGCVLYDRREAVEALLQQKE